MPFTHLDMFSEFSYPTLSMEWGDVDRSCLETRDTDNAPTLRCTGWAVCGSHAPRVGFVMWCFQSQTDPVFFGRDWNTDSVL